MDASVESSRRKLIDAAGAGTSLTSPGWLTELGRLYGGKSVGFPDENGLLPVLNLLISFKAQRAIWII